MHHPGPHLARLLLASYRTLVDAAVVELARRGFDDLRPVLHSAMVAIDGGADTASELGRTLAVSKQAAAKTIATLVDRGYVTAEPDPADRRRTRLRVTALGHRATRAGEQIFDELRQRWADDIGQDRLGRLEGELAAFIGEDTIRPDISD